MEGGYLDICASPQDCLEIGQMQKKNNKKKSRIGGDTLGLVDRFVGTD
jgi:hypothetical protein